MGSDQSKAEVLYEVQRVDGRICSISRNTNNPQFICIKEENLGRTEETCHSIELSDGETLEVCYRNKNLTSGRQNGDAFTPVVSSNIQRTYDDSMNNTYVTDKIESNPRVNQISNVPFDGISGNRDKCTNITVNQYLGQRPETFIRTEQNCPVIQPVPDEMNGQTNRPGNGQIIRPGNRQTNRPSNGQTNGFCQNGHGFPINQKVRSGMNSPTVQINGTPVIFENTGNNDNLGWSPHRLEYTDSRGRSALQNSDRAHLRWSTDNLSIIPRNNRNSVVNPLNRSELRRLT